MPSSLFRGCTSSLTAEVLRELFCLGVDAPRSNVCAPDEIAEPSTSTYRIFTLVPVIQEGNSATFFVETTGVSDGELYWTISGDGITDDDFSFPPEAVSAGGIVEIIDGNGQIYLVASDLVASD